MSKLTEYLKLIPKGIPHTKEIVESIVNNINLHRKHLSENKKDEIIRRRIICTTCPFMSKNALNSSEYYSLVGYNYHTDRNDDHCVFCGCNIEMRTGSLSSRCGIDSWNKDNPGKELTVKWDKYVENK